MSYYKKKEFKNLIEELKSELSEENINIEIIQEIKNKITNLLDDLTIDYENEIDDYEYDIDELKRKLDKLEDELFYKEEELADKYNLTLFNINNHYDLQKLEILDELFKRKTLYELEKLIE